MAMSLAQNEALSTYLSEWPLKWSYERVLTGIENEHEDVLIWEPFEVYPAETLIPWIRSAKEAADRLLQVHELIIKRKLQKQLTKLLR